MVLVLVVPSASKGQLVSEEFCKKVEDLVATPLKPDHWYHNIAFNDECSLEFDIDHKAGIGLKFSLERFVNEKEARKSFKSDKITFDSNDKLHEILLGKKKPKPFYPIQDFWDEALFYDLDGPIMLRKGKSILMMFCDQRNLCVALEEKLRKTPTLFEF